MISQIFWIIYLLVGVGISIHQIRMYSWEFTNYNLAEKIITIMFFILIIPLWGPALIEKINRIVKEKIMSQGSKKKG